MGRIVLFPLVITLLPLLTHAPAKAADVDVDLVLVTDDRDVQPKAVEDRRRRVVGIQTGTSEVLRLTGARDVGDQDVGGRIPPATIALRNCADATWRLQRRR